MTADEVIGLYWKYYLSLEKQVVELERYVEFDLKTNGDTYSAKFLELLQAICSEIDVVGKVLASQCDSHFTPTQFTKIRNWWFYIQNNYYGIQLDPVFFRKETLFPWEGFFVIQNGSKFEDDLRVPDAAVPSWWNSYNNVKHRRSDLDADGLLYYTQASLSNVIYALSGLFILEVLLIERVHGSVDESNLFSCRGHRIFTFAFGVIGD